MWIILRLLLFGLGVAMRVSGYVEYIEVSACENCTLQLTCGELNSYIAIFIATFEPFDNSSSYFDDFHMKYPPVHPRQALNKRCSGVNHCSFILEEDCPGSERWGPGNLTVRYACVLETRITKYCNQNISLPSPESRGVLEGFIQNPGYPRFYLGPEECHWRINVPHMQKIKISILDLSLFGGPSPPTVGCTDVIQITDGTDSHPRRTILATCQSSPHTHLSTSTTSHNDDILSRPQEIVSVTETVLVTLTASASFAAQRGLLLHYTVAGDGAGCAAVAPALRTPRHAYQLYRNGTYATFSCCVGYVWRGVGGGGEREGRLTSRWCHGQTWLGGIVPIPDCQKAENLNWLKKIKYRRKMTESSTFSDVILPSIIMALLFLINGVVVFFIYKYRQRKSDDYTDAEELGTLSTKRNGN